MHKGLILLSQVLMFIMVRWTMSLDEQMEIKILWYVVVTVALYVIQVVVLVVMELVKIAVLDVIVIVIVIVQQDAMEGVKVVIVHAQGIVKPVVHLVIMDVLQDAKMIAQILVLLIV